MSLFCCASALLRRIAASNSARIRSSAPMRSNCSRADCSFLRIKSYCDPFRSFRISNRTVFRLELFGIRITCRFLAPVCRFNWTSSHRTRCDFPIPESPRIGMSNVPVGKSELRNSRRKSASVTARPASFPDSSNGLFTRRIGWCTAKKTSSQSLSASGFIQCRIFCSVGQKSASFTPLFLSA